MFEDKFELRLDKSRRYAKSKMGKMVLSAAQLKGLKLTPVQIQVILMGIDAEGVEQEDINAVKRITKAWQYVTSEPRPLTIMIEKSIDQVLTRDTSYVNGEFKTGDKPKAKNHKAEDRFLEAFMASDLTATNKALTLFLHNLQLPLFEQDNLLASLFIANKLLIDGGAGILLIGPEIMDDFLAKMQFFLETGEGDAFKEWLYDRAIVGPTADEERNLIDPRINRYGRRY